MARRVGFGRDDQSSRPRAARETERAGRGRKPEYGSAADDPRARIRKVRLLLFVIPLVFEAVGLWLLLDAITFSTVAQPATGVVTEVRAIRNDDGVTYRPVIRYRTSAGETVEATTHISSSGYDYRTGARVDILHDPANPEKVRIDGAFSLWALPIGFLAAGSIAFLVLTVALRHTGRARAPAATD